VIPLLAGLDRADRGSIIAGPKGGMERGRRSMVILAHSFYFQHKWYSRSFLA